MLSTKDMATTPTAFNLLGPVDAPKAENQEEQMNPENEHRLATNRQQGKAESHHGKARTKAFDFTLVPWVAGVRSRVAFVTMSAQAEINEFGDGPSV